MLAFYLTGEISMNESPLSDIRIGFVTNQWAKAQKIASHYFPSIDSTNKKAKAEAFTDASFNEHMILFVTDAQTAGRGRGANTWSMAAEGSQLLSTWSFMIESPPHPIVTPMIGLALYRAAVSTWPFLNWNLKAPNDLYLDDRKVAGLLLETLSQGEDHRLLIGLGFNVIQSPEDVGTATALVNELDADTPLLAEDWISFLERLVFEFSFSLQLSFEKMNSTSIQALLVALNKHPLLSSPYVSLDGDGNLATASKKISWHEL
jgi:BirA family transcriptional regulator, biotin operon repressor / biotin---[acetyl-CoA-carboxylase] ligase